jgi:hypothetical protein
LTFFVFLKWIPFGAVADRVFKECKSVGDSRLQGRGPVQHPTMLNFLSNQRRCRLVIRAACCLNLISRLPFRPYCPLVPTCEPHKPLLAKWIWRKRVGVEIAVKSRKSRGMMALHSAIAIIWIQIGVKLLWALSNFLRTRWRAPSSSRPSILLSGVLGRVNSQNKPYSEKTSCAIGA